VVFGEQAGVQIGQIGLKTEICFSRASEALAGLTLGGSLILSYNRITELPAGFGRLDESVGDKVRLDGSRIGKGRSDWVHTIPAHLTSMRALEFGENPHAIRIRDDEDYDSDGGCETPTWTTVCPTTNPNGGGRRGGSTTTLMRIASRDCR